MYFVFSKGVISVPRDEYFCHLLPVELVYLLSGLSFSVQRLEKQIVSFGGRVIGILGNLLDLVGVHLVPVPTTVVTPRASTLKFTPTSILQHTRSLLVGQFARFFGQQRHIVGIAIAAWRFDVLKAHAAPSRTRSTAAMSSRDVA